jgi:hypothetical protein
VTLVIPPNAADVWTDADWLMLEIRCDDSADCGRPIEHRRFQRLVHDEGIGTRLHCPVCLPNSRHSRGTV